jgi:hypothetical protein
LMLIISVRQKLILKWLVYGGHILLLKPQISGAFPVALKQHNFRSAPGNSLCRHRCKSVPQFCSTCLFLVSGLPAMSILQSGSTCKSRLVVTLSQGLFLSLARDVHVQSQPVASIVPVCWYE